jgi:hypothetical protein
MGVAVLAGSVSTAIFVSSALPMLVKAARASVAGTRVPAPRAVNR